MALLCMMNWPNLSLSSQLRQFIAFFSYSSAAALFSFSPRGKRRKRDHDETIGTSPYSWSSIAEEDAPPFFGLSLGEGAHFAGMPFKKLLLLLVVARKERSAAGVGSRHQHTSRGTLYVRTYLFKAQQQREKAYPASDLSPSHSEGRGRKGGSEDGERAKHALGCLL